METTSVASSALNLPSMVRNKMDEEEAIASVLLEEAEQEYENRTKLNAKEARRVQKEETDIQASIQYKAAATAAVKNSVAKRETS
eukprot:6489531-Amphidinium_carterae.1